MASLNFDARNFDPEQVGAGLPVSDENGWPVVITASCPKATKDSTPQNMKGFLEVTFTGIQDPTKGFSATKRYNVWNPSEQTVEMAHRELSALCYVCGVFALVNDGLPGVPELHNIPLRVLVRQQASNPKYTEIYAVKDINGNAPGKAGAAQPQASPPAAPPIPTAVYTEPVQQPFSAPTFGAPMPPVQSQTGANPTQQPQTAAWQPDNTQVSPKPPWD